MAKTGQDFCPSKHQKAMRCTCWLVFLALMDICVSNQILNRGSCATRGLSFRRAFLPNPFMITKSSVLRTSTLLRCTSEEQDVQYIDDSAYEDWLQDMIYSGDIAGYLRKNTKNVVNDDFLLFLKEKIESIGSGEDEEEEKEVLSMVIDAIEAKIRQTDGLTDSEMVFESRLDKILFAPPNQRKQFIEENADLMTEGFVQYIQQELRASGDTDSKVS